MELYIPYLCRDFLLLFCSFYIYPKITSAVVHKVFRGSYGLCAVIALAESLVLQVISKLASYSVYPLMVVLTVSFAQFYCHSKWNISIVASILSFGICFAAFMFSTAFVSAVATLIFHINSDVGTNVWIDMIEICCISIIQFTLCFLLFKIKRFKRGMPFLLQHEISDIGVYISMALLLILSFVANQSSSHLAVVIFVGAVFFCSMSLPIWWKNSTTKFYIEQLRQRELANYQTALQEKEAETAYLRTENEQLSKMIHKDNKLIPTMESSVRELLTAAKSTDAYAWSQKADQLLARLDDASRDRAGILRNYEQDTQKLPSTQSILVDATLSYMLKRANSLGISFDFSQSDPPKSQFSQTLSETEFNTLVADLIENAFHAVEHQSQRSVLVYMGASQEGYIFSVFDSGIPFDADVLRNFGKKRLTTRLSSGGSGIGLMTLFEITQKCEASFCIEEFFHLSAYTKKVSVYFDGKTQFHIITRRQENLQKNVNRPDIIWGTPEH